MKRLLIFLLVITNLTFCNDDRSDEEGDPNDTTNPITNPPNDTLVIIRDSLPPLDTTGN